MENEKLKNGLELLKQLRAANAARERFTDGFGGFDTFAEVWQYVGDNRAQFDTLSAEAERLRRAFSTLPTEVKKEMVVYLRTGGDKETASWLEKYFF